MCGVVSELYRFSFAVSQSRQGTRAFVTSNTNSMPRKFFTYPPSDGPPRKPPANDLIAIGKLIEEQKVDRPYHAGQLFLHKLFRYRGIVVWSMNCQIHERSLDKANTSIAPFYHVLVSRDDWNYDRLVVSFVFIQFFNENFDNFRQTLRTSRDMP